MVISLGVYHCYPFYVFDMYSKVYNSASRIVVVDAAGAASEIERFSALRCDPARQDALVQQPRGCGARERFASRDRYSAGALASRAGTGVGPPLSVHVVRRSWRFLPDAVAIDDCPLLRCDGWRAP